MSKTIRLPSSPGASPPIPGVEPKLQLDHYWQYCVTCGTKLEGRKCKLICPRCGFYHSCSEP